MVTADPGRQPGVLGNNDRLLTVSAGLHTVFASLHPVSARLHTMFAGLHTVSASLHTMFASLQTVSAGLQHPYGNRPKACVTLQTISVSVHAGVAGQQTPCDI